jgi:hypothetical protein
MRGSTQAKQGDSEMEMPLHKRAAEEARRAWHWILDNASDSGPVAIAAMFAALLVVIWIGLLVIGVGVTAMALLIMAVETSPFFALLIVFAGPPLVAYSIYFFGKGTDE